MSRNHLHRSGVRAAAAIFMAAVSVTLGIPQPASAQDKPQKVVLRFYDFTGRDVKLAGSFNDWRPDQGVVTRTANGIVEKIVMLMPGTYQYRLVVDGLWQEDPSNPEQVPNYSGGYNSVLQVEEEHATEHA